MPSPASANSMKNAVIRIDSAGNISEISQKVKVIRGGMTYNFVTMVSSEYFLRGIITVKYIDSLDENVFPAPEINLYVPAGFSCSF